MIYKRILLADDPETIRILENSFFRRAGFSLIVATCDDEVMQGVMEKDPMLVVLVSGLPSLDGANCCRRIKEDPVLASTPVLLVADPGREAEIEGCRNVGCDTILRRPAAANELTEAACRLLGISERAVSRIATDFPVAFDQSRSLRHRGRVRNIARGGFFVAAAKLYPVDTRLQLELILPQTGRALGCEGRVAWVNHPEWLKNRELPPGMGIELVAPCEAAAAALAEVLENGGELRKPGEGTHGA